MQFLQATKLNKSLLKKIAEISTFIWRDLGFNALWIKSLYKFIYYKHTVHVRIASN